MFEQQKAWWKSKTIVASIAVIIAQLALAFGVDLGAAEVEIIIGQGVTVVAAAMAIYGRLAAWTFIGKEDSL